jgi:hypothetical protein
VKILTGFVDSVCQFLFVENTCKDYLRIYIMRNLKSMQACNIVLDCSSKLGLDFGRSNSRLK